MEAVAESDGDEFDFGEWFEDVGGYDDEAIRVIVVEGYFVADGDDVGSGKERFNIRECFCFVDEEI